MTYQSPKDRIHDTHLYNTSITLVIVTPILRVPRFRSTPRSGGAAVELVNVIMI